MGVTVEKKRVNQNSEASRSSSMKLHNTTCRGWQHTACRWRGYNVKPGSTIDMVLRTTGYIIYSAYRFLLTINIGNL